MVASVAWVALWAPRLQRPLTIAIHEGVEGVALKRLAGKFSAERDVTVNVFELPYDALYASEMSEVSASRSKYDVLMVDDPWLPALIGEDDATGPVTRIARIQFSKEECDALKLHDFVPATLSVSVHPSSVKARAQSTADAFTCDELFALPFVGNSQLFVTRRDLQPRWNEPPTKWEEVQPGGADGSTDAGYMARVGAGNSIVTDFMPILWTLSPTTAQQSVCLTAEAPVTGDPLALDCSQTTRAFELIRNLGLRDKATRGVVSVDDFDLTINLVKKHASMAIVWSAWLMAIAKLPSPYNDQLLGANGTSELSVVQVPGGEPVLGAWLLAVPARSAQQRLAFEFVQFATSKENILTAALEGNPPPRISVLESDLYPFFVQQKISLETARARPRTPQWRAMENVLGDCLSLLHENAITTAGAWEGVTQGLEPLRKKQREIRDVLEKDPTDRNAIRGILDKPVDDFSCLPVASIDRVRPPGEHHQRKQ